MSVEAQKLELITWINSLDDKRLLDQLYLQVKKTMESRQGGVAVGGQATSESAQPAPGSPLQLLEQITDAYGASDEPDLERRNYRKREGVETKHIIIFGE